jgi:hypothetical protein
MTTNNPDQKIDQRDLRQIVADKINPLPRSILRRTAFEVLDGEWKFAFDVQNRGREERWYKKHIYTETALLIHARSLFAARNISVNRVNDANG